MKCQLFAESCQRVINRFPAAQNLHYCGFWAQSKVLFKKFTIFCRLVLWIAYSWLDKANQLSVAALGPPHILGRFFALLFAPFNLNSSFRFTTPCYISRRGAERQSSQSLSPLLEYVFVFTNWVKELSEILLVMVFFSVEHLNFLCALRLSAPLRETFNRGF